MGDEILFIESQNMGSVESASDGTYPVVLLTPGLGASAYYSESVVAQYAPTAWPKGTHVYLTHARGAGGEPDPDRLLGSLVEDTTIRESDGAAVNRFKPLRRHADFVEDVHKLVGLSVNASGSVTTGTVDGRTVKIAESIDYKVSNTVDMVSYPGRPGSGFVESAFANRNVHPEPSAAGNEKEERMAVEEEVTKLTESITALVSLVESRLPEAVAPKDEQGPDIASAVAAARIVESADISDVLKAKLIEGINEGNYDVQSEIDEHVALRESIREEVKQEFQESGAVVGAQGNAGGSETATVNGWGK